MFRFTIVLSIICIVAALVLGITYNATSPLIAAQKEKETQEALGKVLPGADRFQERSIDSIYYYECYSGDRLLGYAIFVKGEGYAGTIETLVGLDVDANVTGLEVLSQNETPGLGARCTEIRYGDKEPWFAVQFKGKPISQLDLKHIEAITGATITSKAITDSARETAKAFMAKIGRR